MAKRKKTPFAIHTGHMYVKAFECGINPLVVAIDCLPLKCYGEDPDVAYLSIEDAIAWHEKELAETQGKGGSQKFINALKAAKEKFEKGEVLQQ